MSAVKTLRGDLAVVEIGSSASGTHSDVVVIPNATESETIVFWGTLKMAGAGRVGQIDGNRSPGLLECPGFELGCSVLVIKRFNYGDACGNLDKNELLLQSFDIMACVDSEGGISPSWGWTLVNAARVRREPRLVSPTSSVYIVEEEVGYDDKPLAVGQVVATNPVPNEKTPEDLKIVLKDERHVYGKMAEFWGTNPSDVTPGQRVLFRRFSGWRFNNPQTNQDNDDLMLIPHQDIECIVDPTAELEVLSSEHNMLTGKGRL